MEEEIILDANYFRKIVNDNISMNNDEYFKDLMNVITILANNSKSKLNAVQIKKYFIDPNYPRTLNFLENKGFRDTKTAYGTIIISWS
jgi:predicted AAA+ superfamily ATPase